MKSLKSSSDFEIVIHTDQHISHSLAWWSTKVVCGTALIGSLFLMVIYQIQPLFSFSTKVAQSMVVIGAAITLWHYWILKQGNKPFARPARLETKRGLYTIIRHPMYAGDMLAYSGLYLLAPNGVAAIVLMISFVALARQSMIEDAMLETQFGEGFRQWASQTALLIPRLF